MSSLGCGPSPPGRWTHPSHPGPHMISHMGPAGMLGMVEACPSLNGH